jgi:CheY-like chemotaxis protein
MSNKNILILGYRRVVDNMLKEIILDEIGHTVECIYLPQNIDTCKTENNPDLIIATTFRQEAIINKLKQSPAYQNIPIILISGSYTLNEALACGADELISRPVSKPILIKKIKKYVK